MMKLTILKNTHILIIFQHCLDFVCYNEINNTQKYTHSHNIPALFGLCAITFLGIPNNDEINNTQKYTHSHTIPALFGLCVL